MLQTARCVWLVFTSCSPRPSPGERQGSGYHQEMPDSRDSVHVVVGMRGAGLTCRRAPAACPPPQHHMHFSRQRLQSILAGCTARLPLASSCLELPLLWLSPAISCSLLCLQFPLSETASSPAPRCRGESSHAELAALGAEALWPFVRRDPDLHPLSDACGQSHGRVHESTGPRHPSLPPSHRGALPWVTRAARGRRGCRGIGPHGSSCQSRGKPQAT